MSKYLTSGRFNKAKKIDSKEDVAVAPAVIRNTDSSFLKKDGETKSRLKPPSTRILGTHKKFVLQSASLNSPVTMASSINGHSGHDDGGRSPVLKSVKSTNAQRNLLTTAKESAGESLNYDNDFESIKHRTWHPKSVLKTASGSESKDKKKCVTIIDEKHKRTGSYYNLTGSPSTSHAASRERRVSEGSNDTEGASALHQHTTDVSEIRDRTNIPAESNTLVDSRAVASTSEVSAVATDSASESHVTKSNAIKTSSSQPSAEIAGKEHLPGQSLEVSAATTEQQPVSVTTTSMINGANNNVDSSSNSSNIPSVKEPNRQSHTGAVETAATELTRKTSNTVESSSADTEKTEDEEDYDALRTKSPDGRYIRQNEEIGRGSFKTVFKGLDVETGVAIAWCELMVCHCILFSIGFLSIAIHSKFLTD